MNLFVPHPNWPARQAFDTEVKVMFGLQPKDKWPEQGMARRNLAGNIECWVEPIRPGFHIRARALCPVCMRNMPIGRLQQHSKVHT